MAAFSPRHDRRLVAPEAQQSQEVATAVTGPGDCGCPTGHARVQKALAEEKEGQTTHVDLP